MGTTRVRVPLTARSMHAHASTASSYAAMSAMLHPAPRSGRMTATRSSVRMSAVSAMKWTPQKTMNSLPRARASAAAIWLSFRLSPVRSACWMTASCW